jgi:hypothetical protein
MEGRKPKPPPRSGNAPVAAEAFKTKNQTSNQRDFRADGTQTQASKYRLIWDASIPTGPKFVLTAMAHFSNADGSSIRPAIATVGRMVSLSPKQTRRHVQALVEMGVLTFELERTSKGGTPTRYALNLEVLASLNPPADGSVDKKGQPSHAGTSTLPPVTLNPPTDGSQPTLPKLPSNLGEGVRDITSGRASPALVPVPEIPEYINGEILAELMAERNDLDLLEILIQAKRHHDAGASAVAIAQGLHKLLLNRHWRNLSVETPKAQPTGKRRTTGRKTALVIDPGRDTRAPGRNYDLPGVKP